MNRNKLIVQGVTITEWATIFDYALKTDRDVEAVIAPLLGTDFTPWIAKQINEYHRDDLTLKALHKAKDCMVCGLLKSDAKGQATYMMQDFIKGELKPATNYRITPEGVESWKVEKS